MMKIWITLMVVLSVWTGRIGASEDEHAGHVDRMILSDQDIKDFALKIEEAGPGSVGAYVSLSGEILANANQEAHITPRFEGLVVSTLKNQGDSVQKGEALAVIEANDSLNSYELTSMVEGTVLQKHMTVGEVHDASSIAFIVANLDTVWVHLHVYQKDLNLIQKGSRILIPAHNGLPAFEGVVSYMSPIVDQVTRTTIARVVIDNKERLLRPGMFVDAKLYTGDDLAEIVVRESAIQRIEGRWSVFVQDEEGFRVQPIRIGRYNEDYVEILEGLELGQRYVATGSFVLKAELSKGAFGDGHNH